MFYSSFGNLEFGEFNCIKKFLKYDMLFEEESK
jgi:hypothetical protein